MKHQNISVTGSLNLNGVGVVTSASLNAYTASSDTKIDALIGKTGSYATTGSNTFTGSQIIQGTLTAQTLVVQTVTSSVLYTTGSNIIGSSLSNVQQLTGSVGITGSFALTGSAVYSSTITANGNNIAITPSTSTTYALSVMTNGGGYFRVGRDTSTGTLYGADYAALLVSSGNYHMILGTNDTERVRITNGGNVGIGTATPQERFEVAGLNGNIRLYGRSGISQNTLSNNVYYNGTSWTRDNLSYGAQVVRMDVTNGYFYIDADTTTSGYPTTRLTINASNGNVGIGTTTPTGTYGKLSVAGGVRILDDNNAKLEIGRYSSGASNSYIKLGANSNALVVTNNTDAADLLFLNNSGNIGLGISPSAWDTTQTRTVEIGTIGNYISGYIGSSVLYIGTNSYLASSGWKYARSSTAATQIDTGAGQFRFLYANSGTADASITWSESMRITSSGNLLIGTTTEAGECNLALGAKSSVEGGQLVLQKGTSNTYATHLDNYSDLFRILTGTNTGTSNVVVAVSHTTGVVKIYSLGGSGSRTVTADADGNLSASSDSRLKAEDKNYKIQGLAEILKLKPRAYKWLSDIEKRGEEAVTEVGFFADEVKDVIPSAAPLGQDGMYGFYDRAVIASLVNAVQELKAENDSLKEILQRNNIV